MIDRKLMQQALDALEWCFANTGFVDPDATMQALREKLANCDRCGKKLSEPDHIHTCSPQVQPYRWVREDQFGCPHFVDENAIGSFPLYTIPQPKQEPVFHLRSVGDVSADELERLAQSEQEPVAWLGTNGDVLLHAPEEYGREDEEWFPLVHQNTAPKPRQWQGLTAPEQTECYDLNPARFANNIEAKLREKNA